MCRTVRLLITVALLLSLTPAGVAAGKRRSTMYQVDAISEYMTPRSATLAREDLRMPGLGLTASGERLQKRLLYAAEHNWLQQAQLDKLTNSLLKLNENERLLKQQNKLDLRNMQLLANDISNLNEQFEEFVSLNELSAPGREGLMAREAMLRQRIGVALEHGKIDGKQAKTYRSRLSDIRANLAHSGWDSEKIKELSSSLFALSTDLEKHIRSPQVAISGKFIAPRFGY